MSAGPWKKKKYDKLECFKCKATLVNLTVGRTSFRKDGTKRTYYICRPCNALKKRQERLRNGEAERKALNKWRESNPQKVKAHKLARKHIELEPCEVCGEKAIRHHDDYSKPLEVRFVCPVHHKALHRGELCLK